jgi:hypothetical protein
MKRRKNIKKIKIIIICCLTSVVQSDRTNRRSGDESQRIAAWGPLYRIQHPGRDLSRLQTIPRPHIAARSEIPNKWRDHRNEGHRRANSPAELPLPASSQVVPRRAASCETQPTEEAVAQEGKRTPHSRTQQPPRRPEAPSTRYGCYEPRDQKRAPKREIVADTKPDGHPP